ncbi:MAG: TIGR03089 family protein [Dermatophilaceae bacterium]
MPTPADVLAALVRTDRGVPRLTWYDDDAGERIELSAAVLSNWVAKAANLLQEDADAGPGTTVRLALPPHWRALYWAVAAWSVGATVALGSAAAPGDVLVGCDPRVTGTHEGYAVHVTLPALARSGPQTPPGVVDEARELATYGDRFDAYAEPSPDDVALSTDAGRTAYRDLVQQRDWPPQPRVRVAGDLERVLRESLAAWAMGGSVVLIAAPGADEGGRLASERVTVDLA